MKILVVDDEADVQLLFEQRFRREIREGIFSFAFAFSGEEALAYLQQGHYSEVVLILSDINMPGMSGLELLRCIKQEHPNPPPQVMMITAYGDDASYQKAMELGANNFLAKPLDFAALRQMLLPLNEQ
ncbi:response regulator [Hymenobacter taeanensis]|uniref:Response regulator n=1 Tax=Hymenobacter taeanensis TaxID=2735321 RepID=A0A6M6BHA2_9BACT|nr:response regulator [Hymenobacter taeanensis]QJX47941.1 response regulator [Hymenobacter taeanensis]